MSEYYIRQPDSEEARGPFDLQRIADLFEAEQIDRTTLYYDEDRDEWIPLVDNASIREVVFPEKKHLGLKARETVDMLSYQDDAPAVTVDEMLAAAEGQTDETKHLKAKINSMEKAAALSLPAMGIMMVLSAVALIFPDFGIIPIIRDEKEYGLLLQHPLLIVGIFDLFLSICCFLSVTDSFPLIRFRAMLGFGYFCYVSWAWGDFNSLAAAALGSIGLYLCTVTLSLPVMFMSIIGGILGMGALAAFAVMGAL